MQCPDKTPESVAVALAVTLRKCVVLKYINLTDTYFAFNIQ